MSAVAPQMPKPRELRPSSETFTSYLMGRARLEAEGARSTKRVIDRMAYLATLIYEGKHRFVYSPAADWYFPNENQNHYTSLYHPDNYYRFLIKSNAKEFVKSAPSIRARAESIEDDKAVYACRVANAVKDDFVRRFRLDHIRQVEYRRVQLAGNFAVFVDWNRAGGKTLEFPVHEQRDVLLAPGAFQCFECGSDDIFEVPEASPETCPACGSYSLEVVQPVSTQVNQVVDRLKIPTGDWILRSVSALEINVNATARDHQELTDVSWLRWRYIKNRRKAEAEFGFELKAGLDTDSDDRGPKYQHRLATGAHGGSEVEAAQPTAQSSNACVITEDWFTPDQYADFIAGFDHEVPGPDGKMIQIAAGQNAADAFPHGIRLFTNGGMALRVEQKAIRKHWQFYGFDPHPESFWYSGTEDAISGQLDLNEVNAFIKTHTMTSAMPDTVVRSKYIKSYGQSSSPAKVIETGDQLPNEMSLSELIHHEPPASMSAEAYALRDQIKEGMQYSTGALNNFNGEDAARDRTATQTQILEASALAHAEAVMIGLANAEGRLYRLATALWREHGDVPRAFEIQGEASELDVAEFRNVDLVVDVDFAVEAGTVLPRRPYQERDDYDQYLKRQTEWITAHNGQPMPTKLEKYLANVYGLSSILVESRQAETVCREHLKAIKQLCQQAPEIAMQQLGKRAQGMMQQAQQAQATLGPMPPEAALMMRQQLLQQAQQAQTDPQYQAELILEYIKQSPEAPAKVIPASQLHLPMRDWYQEYLNSEKGMREPLVVQYVIAGRMVEQILASGEQQAPYTQAQIIAQQPAQQAAMQQAMMAQAAAAPREEDGGDSGPKKSNDTGERDDPSRHFARPHPMSGAEQASSAAVPAGS